MPSLSRFFTLLKVYFGDSLSRLLSLVYRGKMNESVDSSSAGDLTTDTECAAFKSDEGSSSGTISQLLDALESSPDTNEFTGQDLLRAAVDYDLDALPSIPSIFSSPEPRPPLNMSPSSPCKQDFGAPSNLYYDRRTLGDVTNFRDFDQAKGTKLNTEVKPRKPLKAKQSKSRCQSPAMATVKVLPIEDSSATVVVKLAPLTLPAPVAVIDHAPAPGSEEWNTNKASVLAQARNWSNQVQASRRHSLPVPPLPIDLPVLERSHRHSAPPVLEAKDTIAALDEETNAKGIKEEGPKRSEYSGRICKQNARKFSAIALEEGRGEIFVIGKDSDEEEVITTVSRPSRQEHTTDIPPTVNPESSNLVSSISASASMEALASISTWSITDLFNTLDAVMTGPTWLRVLSRSDDIMRRTNDSIV
ncbi:hypothetical protein DFH08DRAFT_949574 [Mycena albidolilacea]|uniref:Uncharacterized protein n=1 Tax=Mycena albidolilacea TaxID=1033008 RepID=A0AAD7AN42_9AGAR|nr:hypothetical protein DFH08DRAFT_949574 [Mycena albidolilacea]